MPKFRKKPVTIEAVQFTGENRKEVLDFVKGRGTVSLTNKHVTISTSESIMRGNVGDWIIMGEAGEFYSCKPGIFSETYDPLE